MVVTKPTLTRCAVPGATTLPSVLLWTLWRSGTHWMADMLSDLMGVPAHYDSDDAGDYGRETIEQLRSQSPGTILIRHISLRPEAVLPEAERLGTKVVFLYRDPRDVLASQVNMRKHREGYRRGLPPFPEMSIDAILEWELRSLGRVYTDLLPAWASTKHPLLHRVRYEDLLRDTVSTMVAVARFLGLRAGHHRLAELAAAHRFERLTSRKRGEEDKTAHLRRGIIGDHRNQFTEQQRRRLNDLLAEALLRMGYSIDASGGDGHG